MGREHTRYHPGLFSFFLTSHRSLTTPPTLISEEHVHAPEQKTKRKQTQKQRLLEGERFEARLPHSACLPSCTKAEEESAVC